MKIKEYDEMVNYLTRKKPQETKRQETTMERINRVKYEVGETKEKPKHIDNKNIYSFEDQPILRRLYGRHHHRDRESDDILL